MFSPVTCSLALNYHNICVLMKTYHYAVTDHKIGSIAAWLEFVEVCTKVDALIRRQKWEHSCCPMIIIDTRVVSKKEGEEGEDEGDDVSKQHSADPLSPRAAFALESDLKIIRWIVIWADLAPWLLWATIDCMGLILVPWLRTRKCLFRRLIALPCNDNLRSYIRTWWVVGEGWANGSLAREDYKLANQFKPDGQGGLSPPCLAPGCAMLHQICTGSSYNMHQLAPAPVMDTFALLRREERRGSDALLRNVKYLRAGGNSLCVKI